MSKNSTEAYQPEEVVTFAQVMRQFVSNASVEEIQALKGNQNFLYQLKEAMEDDVLMRSRMPKTVQVKFFDSETITDTQIERQDAFAEVYAEVKYSVWPEVNFFDNTVFDRNGFNALMEKLMSMSVEEIQQLDVEFFDELMAAITACRREAHNLFTKLYVKFDKNSHKGKAFLEVYQKQSEAGYMYRYFGASAGQKVEGKRKAKKIKLPPLVLETV